MKVKNMSHERPPEDSRSSVIEAVRHTPGPWGAFWNEENARLHLGCWRFTHKGHHALPLLRCSEGNATARANAHLIAAAPDLLAALKHAQEALYWYQGEAFEIAGHRAGDVIAKALAKAETPVTE
jgi:hypothetical protein